MSVIRIARNALRLCVAMFSLTAHAQVGTQHLQLPSLGDTSAGLISTTDEYDFGRKLIRKFRAGLPESSDPFIEAYLTELLGKLSQHSELTNPKLDLLVIQDSSLNAFAAPGGIVGVNIGTFAVAQNEQQLASILAHELAHLSQRHYARQVNEASKNNFITMAAMLAGIIAIASSGSDNAIAALPAAQAAAIQAQLKFSREMEQEADRVGMQTLINAGFDPYGMPEMFDVMLRNTRYRTKVPEFLLSHPVTESRVADSLSRASRYPRRHYPLDTDFQIVKARVLVELERNAHVAVKRFKDEVQGTTMPPLTARYGLVRALTRAGETKAARQEFETLKDLLPDGVVLAVAMADIQTAEGDHEGAIETLSAQLNRHPNSHPLNVHLAEVLMKAGQYARCEALLAEHVKRQPHNSYVWYLLAEAHGLAGHILDVHKARAEYFILLGIFNKAEIQLRNALRLTEDKDFQARARLEQRLIEVRKMKEEDLS